MTLEMLRWATSCPVTDSYRVHPSLLMEIEQMGTFTEIKPSEHTDNPWTNMSARTLAMKPLEVDVTMREHTLAIIEKGRKTPSLAIEFEQPYQAH